MREPFPALTGILCPKGFAVDSLMNDVVEAVRSRGGRVAGAIQEDLSTGESGCIDLVLRDLLDGTTTPITENRGAGATACRLDPRGLMEVAVRLELALEAEPDLLIVSRFGKAEVEGGGLRSVFASAMLRGTPVLTAVREINWADWALFHGGLAVDLKPDSPSLHGWLEALYGC